MSTVRYFSACTVSNRDCLGVRMHLIRLNERSSEGKVTQDTRNCAFSGLLETKSELIYSASLKRLIKIVRQLYLKKVVLLHVQVEYEYVLHGDRFQHRRTSTASFSLYDDILSRPVRILTAATKSSVDQ